MCSVLINKIRKYFPAEAITRTVDKALFWHRLQGITEEDNKQKGLVSKINLPGSQRSATRTSWRARNQRRAAQRVPSDRHTAAPAKPPAAHRANQPRDNGRAAPKKRRLSSARRCWGNGPGLPCSTTTSNKDEAMPQERRAGQVPRHSPEGRAGSPPPQSAALRWAPGTARPGAGDGGRGLRPPHRTETRRENGSRKRDNPPRRGNRRRAAGTAAAPPALPPGRAHPPAPHLWADVGHEGRLGRLGPAAQHGSGRLPSAPAASGTGAASRDSSSARPRPRHPAHGTRPPRHLCPAPPRSLGRAAVRHENVLLLLAGGRGAGSWGSAVSVPRCEGAISAVR